MSPDHIHVTSWNVPAVDKLDLCPYSAYVELFWLPVLGPAATVLFRRLNLLLGQHPEGFAITFDELGASLGLGPGDSRHAPLPRAIGRCIRFGLARRPGPDHLAVRRFVGPLSERHLTRLHSVLQRDHANYLALRAQPVDSLDNL